MASLPLASQDCILGAHEPLPLAAVGAVRSLLHKPTATATPPVSGLLSMLKPAQKQALLAIHHGCSETPHFFLHSELK